MSYLIPMEWYRFCHTQFKLLLHFAKIILHVHVWTHGPIINKKQKIYPKNKKDLGMGYHTPPLKQVKKQGEMPLPSLGPIPLNKLM